MSDEKLHPEVAKAVQQYAACFEEYEKAATLALTEVALLAASKAREEERERNTDACAALANDCASPSWNDAIEECISAIYRGKP